MNMNPIKLNDWRWCHKLDNMVRAESAFRDFNDLLGAGKDRGYRPSLEMSSYRRYLIAECYDEAMAERGDERRAYRYGPNSGMLAEEVNDAHGKAISHALMYGLNRPNNPVELAKAFKAMSRSEMQRYKWDLRKAGNRDHLVHRGIEIIPLDANGERVEDVEYLDMKQGSGKQFAEAAYRMMKDPDVKSIYYGGGIDQYDPFPQYMEDMRNGGWSDYAPGVHYWGIEVPVSLFNKEAS